MWTRAARLIPGAAYESGHRGCYRFHSILARGAGEIPCTPLGYARLKYRPAVPIHGFGCTAVINYYCLAKKCLMNIIFKKNNRIIVLGIYVHSNEITKQILIITYIDVLFFHCYSRWWIFPNPSCYFTIKSLLVFDIGFTIKPNI